MTATAPLTVKDMALVLAAIVVTVLLYTEAPRIGGLFLLLVVAALLVTGHRRNAFAF